LVEQSIINVDVTYIYSHILW